MTEQRILDNIRCIREGLGLSQASMAEELGIGRTSYINFEKGRVNIFCKTLKKFSAYCGVSETDIISGNSSGDGLLADSSDFEEERRTLVADYEKRLAAEKEKYESALKVISAHEITIRTLTETKDFLLTQLHKND